MKKLHIILLIMFALVGGQAVIFSQSKFEAMRSNGVEFIENKGQIADQFGNINWDVLFIAEVESGTIAIRRDGISFTFIKNDETAVQKRKTDNQPQGMQKDLSAIEPNNIEMYRVDMKLNNSRIPRKIATKEMTGDYNNYYLAQCPE